jgi:hypothetical protein
LQFLSLSLKYTRLTDEQLRFFPRYLVNLDMSHCSALTSRRLSKLLARCRQLRFLALNSCPAAGAVFGSEQLLGSACEGMQVQRPTQLMQGNACSLCLPPDAVSSRAGG